MKFRLNYYVYFPQGESIKSILSQTAILLCAVLIFISTCLTALENSASVGSQDFFEVTEAGETFTTIEFNLPEYMLEKIELEDDIYHRLSHPSAAIRMEEGLPEVLSFSVLVSIPASGIVTTAKPTINDQQILTGINLFPSQGLNNQDSGLLPAYDSATTSKLIKDDNFYTKDIIYPEQPVGTSKPAILRDIRLISLTVNPFRYNPSDKELTVVNSLTVRVNYDTQQSGENEIRCTDRPLSRSFAKIYEGSILNYGQFHDPHQGYQQRSILIVKHHSNSIVGLVSQFAEWKRNKGFIVNKTNTAENPTNRDIKNYIAHAYENWENPPEYIVIIGGGHGNLAVPFWHEYHGPGDHPYTTLEGDDNLPDVFIGRISVENAHQLATVWNKIRRYEQNPCMDINPGWFENNLLVGDPRVSGISTINTNRYIKEIMLRRYSGYTFREVYEGNFVNQMNNALEEGVGFFSFRGLELMAGWLPGYDGHYHNHGMTPNATFFTCNTLDYSGGKQAEPFFRTGTPTTPRGGVSVIGMTTNYTLTSFNSCLAGGVYDGIINKDLRTMGEALAHSKLYLWQMYNNLHPTQPPQYFHWANLIGDPSMDVWLRNPRSFNVDYPRRLPYGSNSLSITVTDKEDKPLEDVWVTIRTEDNSVFATGYTDKHGKINLYYEQTSQGEINLTVTKPDFIPYMGCFEITEEPSVAFHDIYTDDEFAAADVIDFKISVKNFGLENINGVTGNISTDCHKHIEILTDYAEYEDIETNSLSRSNSYYTVHICPAAPHELDITFELLIADNNDNQWLSRFDIKVENARLKPVDLIVGNGNYDYIDPRQQETIQIPLHNKGSQPAAGIEASISSSCPGLIIIDKSAYYGDINVDGAVHPAEDVFIVYADSTAIPGMVFEIKLLLFNEEGFKQEHRLDLPVGKVTVTDPFGPDAYGYWCYDEGDVDYVDAPVYQWIEIVPKNGGQGIDTGLQSDYRDNQQTVHIGLPFPFQYYGVVYDSISVCSNGWISFGITEQSTHKNWRLPGALGPYAMAAVFWENLSLKEGGVYTLYCEEQNIFVIQWENALNVMNDAPQTFQIILYDPQHHPTVTGDGPIKYQYKVFNNINDGANIPPGYGNWGNYATIGIVNHKCTTGLEYTFNNRYPAAAKPLGNESAILFTTGYGTPVKIDDKHTVSAGENIPVILKNAWPNPFNPHTNIEFILQDTANVSLVVYDAKGRKVNTVIDERLNSGKHRYLWPPEDHSRKTMPSGIYFYQLKTDEYQEVKKMILIK